MVKIKSGETLSLDKTKQKKVAKQAKKLRKNIKDGKISIKEEKRAKKISVEQSRGLIYISHIPHGFYEIEMKNYFKQFGAVTNVRVCRSRKSGNSKGFGYVEFSHPDVAKIAADTMNNYLMFKRRITAEYVPYEKRPKGLFQGKGNTLTRYSAKVRRDRQISANASVDVKTHLKRSSSRLSNLTKKLQKLQNAKIDYDIKPVHLPEGIKQEKKSDVTPPTHMADPFDSDIEIKIPMRRSVRSIQSKVSMKKSKTSNKTVESSTSNKVLLAKSLDSVKALLSTKSSSKASDLKAVKSTKKVNKATSIDVFKKVKKPKRKSRGITKKTKKPTPLNTDTVKKIAQELIRKRGDSLLSVFSSTKKKSPAKKKSGAKSAKSYF